MVIVNIISQLDKERGENLEKVFNFIATIFVHQWHCFNFKHENG